MLAVAVIGWATNQPLVFASLGSYGLRVSGTAAATSARAYNLIVGHLIGLSACFLAVFLLNAWAAPNVIATGIVSSRRVWAVVISAAATTLVSLVLNAAQTAALATTLLVSLGAMQTRRDATAIIVGVLLIVAIGEPVRRLRPAVAPILDSTNYR